MHPVYFLVIFILPVGVVTGYLWGGWHNWIVPVLVFGLIPALDLAIGRSTANPLPSDEARLSEERAYRYITYAAAPLQLGLVAWGAWVFSRGQWGLLERAGFVFALGLCSGAVSINVSHELIHRVNSKWEPWIGRAMLLSVLYLHWSIEHVLGHHRNVATAGDPATGRLGEGFWRFFPRTVAGGFANAWNIEAERLSRKGALPWGVRNRVLWFTVAEVLLLALFYKLFGFLGVVCLVLQGLVAVFLLEIVNYIEHYGMERKKTGDGKYEPVQPVHSWNASNILTNLFLFNLQRHSDHHYRPGRRNELLRHFDEAPQLPTGYAGMILLAVVPPLWFAYMDPRVKAHRQALEE